MCTVEINKMDILTINKGMTKESKQTKTNTFCGSFEKSCLEQLQKEPHFKFS